MLLHNFLLNGIFPVAAVTCLEDIFLRSYSSADFTDSITQFYNQWQRLLILINALLSIFVGETFPVIENHLRIE